MNVKENLIAARAKIANPKDWIQDILAVDSCGHSASPRSKEACKFCAVGAIFCATKGLQDTIFDFSLTKLNNSALLLYKKHLAGVNDILGHEAVLKVYDHAISNTSEV